MVQEIIIISVFLIFYTIIINNKQKLSKFLKLVDKPDNKRKIHSKPTPLLGGLLILLIILLNTNYLYQYLPLKEFVILCSLIIFYFVMSVIDDIKNLNSYFRLVSLFCVTYILLSFSDLFVLKNLFFSFNQINLDLGLYNIFISTLCILLLVNALNLSDGINGLSTLMIITWFIYIKLILFDNHTFLGVSAIISLFIIFYNIYKGSYFMGDYGVTVSALLIGMMSITTYNLQESNLNQIYVEELFLLFFIPGLDMFRLFVQRLLKKKDPFSADKNHLHHILINRYNLKKSLIIYFVITFTPIFLFKNFDLNTLLLITIYSVLYFSIFIKKISKYF